MGACRTLPAASTGSLLNGEGGSDWPARLRASGQWGLMVTAGQALGILTLRL